MTHNRHAEVREVDVDLVELPLVRPIVTPTVSIDSVGCVLVTLRTGGDVSGTGFCFTVNREHLVRLGHAARSRGDAAVGATTLALGPLPTLASPDEAVVHAAFDVAHWDAVARNEDRPLSQLWGAERDEVDTYASDGFWLSDSIDQLEQDADRYRSLGYRAVKVRVGHNLPADLERIRAVANAVGPDVAIYVDANQSFTADEAIARAAAFADAGVAWFEEPVAADDVDGHARVRAESTIEIASGESAYGSVGVQPLLDADAVDVVMPDLQRVGGYTEFRRVAAAARHHDIALSSHFFTEHTLALAGSEPGMRTVESMGWFAALFAEAPVLSEGRLVIPHRPGHGFSFAPDVVKRYGL